MFGSALPTKAVWSAAALRHSEHANGASCAAQRAGWKALFANVNLLTLVSLRRHTHLNLGPRSVRGGCIWNLGAAGTDCVKTLLGGRGWEQS